MKLSIENIGKIHSAEIEFNGITVIAGENNTGKSTVGKTLYGVFNSCYNITNHIKRQKATRLKTYIRHAILSQSSGSRLEKYAVADSVTRLSNDIIFKLLEDTTTQNANTYEYVVDFFNEYLSIEQITDFDDVVEQTITAINDLNEVTEQEYMISRIGNYFSNLFNTQFVHCGSDGASVVLKTKNGMFNGTFDSINCKNFSLNFSFTNNALFIDSPSILDNYSSDEIDISRLSVAKYELLTRLKSPITSDTEDIDKAIINQKLETINELLSYAVPGTFDKSDRFGSEQYLFTGEEKPIKLSNLSAGVKAFLIIKKLLENNQFKQRDVLILDEPEINLHPAWQLIYAEMIVLLQEKFDLTVLLSTHSPYFLSAIEAFSKKHHRTQYCKYYLAENDNSLSSITDVTDNVNKIYLKLAKPLDILEEIESNED